MDEKKKGEQTKPVLSNNEVQALLAEYQVLNEELRGVMRIGLYIAFFSLTGGIALIGYLIREDVGHANILFLRGGILFLSPLAIVLPCFLALCQCNRGIVKLGAYIEKLIEPKMASCLRWQTALGILSQEKYPDEVSAAIRAIMFSYLVLTIVCFLRTRAHCAKKPKFCNYGQHRNEGEDKATKPTVRQATYQGLPRELSSFTDKEVRENSAKAGKGNSSSYKRGSKKISE
jgi:hypothetical protein